MTESGVRGHGQKLLIFSGGSQANIEETCAGVALVQILGWYVCRQPNDDDYRSGSRGSFGLSRSSNRDPGTSPKRETRHRLFFTQR